MMKYATVAKNVFAICSWVCVFGPSPGRSEALQSGALPGSISANMNSSTRHYLDVLYRATGGNMWKNSFGWNPVNTSAYGVTFMDGPGGKYATKIILPNNGLNGTIPHLYSLSELTVLNLGRNNLHGTIPSSLRHLQNLRELRLHQNQLEGSIPERLSELVSIELINFRHNKLSKHVPYSWYNVLQMRDATINLRGNNLFCPRTNGDYAALFGIMDDYVSSEMTKCRCQAIQNSQTNYTTPLYLGTYVIGTTAITNCSSRRYNIRTCDTDDSKVTPAGWDVGNNPC